MGAAISDYRKLKARDHPPWFRFSTLDTYPYTNRLKIFHTRAVNE